MRTSLSKASTTLLSRKTPISPHTSLFFSTFPQKPLDKLVDDLSKKFLETHHEYAQTKLSHVKHVIVSLKGQLLLFQHTPGGHQLMTQATTPACETSYKINKAIVHCSVELTMILANLTSDDTISTMKKAKLLRLKRDLISLKQHTDEITPFLKPIHLTLSTIDCAYDCQNRMLLDALRVRYMQQIAPMNEVYGHQAASIQLQGMHHIIQAWMRDYYIDLAKTYIIIVGERGPIKGLIERQYFDHLYAKNNLQSDNTSYYGIICSEMLAYQIRDVDCCELIEDLGRYLANFHIGKAMLNHEKAMEEDILGKHAPTILPRLSKMTPDDSICPVFRK